MKIRLLPLALAALTLVACGETPSSSAAESSVESSAKSELVTWKYLNFLEGEKACRIDVFDMEDGLQISYGNTALASATNNVTLDDNAKFSANKDLANEKSFNAIIIAQKKDGSQHNKVYGGVEGDHILEWFSTVGNDQVVGYDRAYVAFSLGKPAKWTKGLNTAMDELISALVGEN